MGAVVALFIFTTLWSLIFFSLMKLSLRLVRPWSVLQLIPQTRDWDLVTQFYFWVFPTLSLSLIGFGKLNQLLEPAWKQLYGNAHWASRHEMKKMGFLKEEGNVVVGKLGATLLRYSLTNHLLVFAPSRSGKGVSLVIPNALHWQGSLLALDNKYEIFDYTSGYRAQSGSEVYRFSPAQTHYQTHCINPLDYVDRVNPCKRVTDLHLILDILIAHSDSENKMWVEEARSLALGLLLWLMQSERNFALSELSALVKGGQLELFLQQVIQDHTIADNLISIDPPAFLAIQNFLQKAPKEQSGVRTTLASMLRLWEDPLICAATNRSDFDFRDLRKRPITVYLSFGTHQISRLASLINLLVQLFLNVMLSHLPTEEEPYKVLCLLDEINRFGRMDKLKDGFGDLAGYGVHLMPIIQNVGQFYSIYGGRDQSDIFFQNTDLKIGFRQNAPTDKEFLSKELGNRTIRIKNRSYATNREGSNYSESLIERPLLSPTEIGRLSKRQQIIITGDGVIRCHKITYYKDRQFKRKLLPAAIIPTVKPQFPIIDIKKEAMEETLDEDNNETNFKTKKDTKSKYKPSNTKTFLSDTSHPSKADGQTSELIEYLAQSFEEEGIE